MKIIQGLQNLINSITEGFARIFGPDKDQYPNIGVQPYEGEPNTKSDETK